MPKSQSFAALFALLIGLILTNQYLNSWSYDSVESEFTGIVIEQKEDGLLLKRYPDMFEQFVGGDWEIAGSENGNLMLFQNQKDKLQLYHITPEKIDELEYPARDYPAERVAFSKQNEWLFIEWPSEAGYVYCVLDAQNISSQECDTFEIQGDGRLYWSAEEARTYVKLMKNGEQIHYKVGESGFERIHHELLSSELNEPSLALRLAWILRGDLQLFSRPNVYFFPGEKAFGLIDTGNNEIVIQ